MFPLLLQFADFCKIACFCFSDFCNMLRAHLLVINNIDDDKSSNKQRVSWQHCYPLKRRRTPLIICFISAMFHRCPVTLDHDKQL